MNNVLALGILIAGGSAVTGLAAGAQTPDVAHAMAADSNEAMRYDAEAAQFERQADAFAFQAKRYALAGKPAATVQARQYADVSDRYRAKAAQSRELAANARRSGIAPAPTPRE
jgi:hypothetical protein